LATSEYASHYNVKLEKCLMLLSLTAFSHTTQRVLQTVTLYDAFEHRDYAAFSRTEIDKPPDAPISCKLTPTYSETLYCKTRAEFGAFVAGYMEQ
jgi:hypothetical protein